jgi:hypothetical protein
MSAAVSLSEELDRDVVRTTVLLRTVTFVCPHCGGERLGTLVDGDDGTAHVECHTCTRIHLPKILDVPPQCSVDHAREMAVWHGRAALRNAEASRGCTSLAYACFRRLRPELTTMGKARLVNQLLDELGGSPSPAQRSMLTQLCGAMGLSAAQVCGLIAVR